MPSMSSSSTMDLERKAGGTGMFLPRVSASRPVKWAAAGNEGVLNSSALQPPPPAARAPSGSHTHHAVIENALTASGSHVLPNLTPVSSPTAGAVHTLASSFSGRQAYSGTMQLSNGAPSEAYSSSWSEHLAAAPEVGGWSIKRVGSAASSSPAYQQPRSGARMMQQLQQHQQLQQQMQQVQVNWGAPTPPPPQQDTRSLNQTTSSSSSSTMNVAAHKPVPLPPQRRGCPTTAAADNTYWDLTIPASATTAPPGQSPASGSFQMQHGYSHLDTLTDACGNSFVNNESVARTGSNGSVSRAAQAAALASMMTGSEAQPKFWGLAQQPATHDVRSASGSFSGGMNVCLQEQQQQQVQQQQQQQVQYHQSASHAGASLARGQQGQQLQMVQQAAVAAGGRMFDSCSSQLQQAVGGSQQPDMLLSEVDAQLLQLLQLRKHLGPGPGTAPAAAATGKPMSQGPAYSTDSMFGAHANMLAASGGFSACDGAAGVAYMPLSPAVSMPGMTPGEQVLLQLPAGGGLLQLQMAAAAAADESASQLAALALDAMGQSLQPLQHSEPCFSAYRDMMASGSYEQQQQQYSGPLMPGQEPARQPRVSEVKEKMRQLADVQLVQRQLQEELLALLQ